MFRLLTAALLVSTAGMTIGARDDAQAQQVLPPVEVVRPQVRRVAAKPKPVVRRPTRVATTGHARASVGPRAVRPAASVAAVPTEGPSPSGSALLAPSAAAVAQTAAFDARRADLSPRGGANAYDLGRAAIEALPQGDNGSFDKIILQLPGVTQDSAGSGDFHIRNEHANVQYRINGILLPEGISGFSQILDPSFVGSLALLDGVLPAQYGLHTAGILDITTRSGAFDNGGSVGVYGGSNGTAQTSVTQGGTIGDTQYFVTGRFNRSNLGIENPTSAHSAFHDETNQGRFFGYVSKQLDDNNRLTFITGTNVSRYQIPNSPNQAPAFTAFGTSNFDSLNLRENQSESSFYNVLALQHSAGNLDAQLSYFSRYSTIHFVPDQLGDLVFNGVASDVFRDSLVNGVQGDIAYRTGPHTLRFGFQTSVERTRSLNANTVLPLDAGGNPVDAPFGIADNSSKTGFLGSVYAQDEWRLTNQLTLNAGLRFDQANQYVSANQVSPRVAFVYKPFEDTTLHIGYARYFTPPEQVLAAPSNVSAFANTTLQPDTFQNDPTRPERSDYIDGGITQKLMPGLTVGVDGYYKRARNLLDDGQFGQALVLTTFNYDRAYNIGGEFKATYENEGFRAYANFAYARQRATQVSSNQYLFGADELAYIGSNYVYTDHAQTLTASGGASYLFHGTRISADVIYGSGLRDGFANTGTVSPYAQVNLGLSHEFKMFDTPKVGPLTVRFDVINLFDHSYQIRDGSGIGVFAPQYAQRRAFFAGLSQKF
jgi:outer membrane receptor protein involved in Fe transport